MVPGALISALLGRFVGQFTDRFGSIPTLYLAFLFYGIGFILLSSIIGAPPWIVSIVFSLIFIAYPFFHTGVINFILITLAKNDEGVGTGIYNLSVQIAGSFSAAIIGKLLDHPSPSRSLNPLLQTEGTLAIYSNIFIGLFLLTLLNSCIFYLFSRSRATRVRRDSQ